MGKCGYPKIVLTEASRNKADSCWNSQCGMDCSKDNCSQRKAPISAQDWQSSDFSQKYFNQPSLFPHNHKVGPRPHSSLFSTCGALFWENCYIILGTNSSYPSCTCHRAPEPNSCLNTIPSLVSDTKLNSDPLQKKPEIFFSFSVQRLTAPLFTAQVTKKGHVGSSAARP